MFAVNVYHPVVILLLEVVALPLIALVPQVLGLGTDAEVGAAVVQRVVIDMVDDLASGTTTDEAMHPNGHFPTLLHTTPYRVARAANVPFVFRDELQILGIYLHRSTFYVYSHVLI